MVLAISIGVMALSGSKLRDVQQTYQIGEESYKNLIAQVRPSAPPALSSRPTANSPGTGSEAGSDETTGVDIPDMVIDFDALHAINPDAVAWLYSPGTVIDYPIVRAFEYNYYLHHLPDGTYNANGTLFIDYNWKSFADRLTIVYGHNMRSGQMFASLSNYKRQEYFDTHPYLYLYTEDGESYRIDLIYGCVIGVGEWRDRAYMFEVNLDSLLTYAARNTTFKSEAQYSPDDRLIVLSTCSYEFDNARYIVVGVLRS